MPNKTNTTAKKARPILTFEASGPVRAMIESELKRLHRPGTKPPHGSLKRVIELSIIEALGAKYPKLADRWKVLKEEGAI